MNQSDVVAAVAASLLKKDVSQQCLRILENSTEATIKSFFVKLEATLIRVIADQTDLLSAALTSRLQLATMKWVEKNQLVVLPENTRYIGKYNDTDIVVVENKPATRTINFYYGDNLSPRKVRLSFPYVQFVMHIEPQRIKRLFVGITKAPITAINQDLFKMPLPNVDNHAVCVGQELSYQDLSKLSLVEKCDKIIASFWQSQFGGDYLPNYNDFISNNNLRVAKSDQLPGFGERESPEGWQKRCKEDPFFASTAVYRKGATAGALIGSTTGLSDPQFKENIDAVVKANIANIKSNLQTTDVISNARLDSVSNGCSNALQALLKDIIAQVYGEVITKVTTK